MSDILDELSVVDLPIFPEAFLDSPDFLCGQENTERVQKQIECMLVHQACAFGIELAYFAIAFLEVFHCFAEQLELEFVVYFFYLVYPVHLFFICITYLISGTLRPFIFISGHYQMYGKALTRGFESGFKNLRQFLYKRYLPKTYRFNSQVPVDPNAYFFIPPQKWLRETQQSNLYLLYIYLSLFTLGFFAADFLYTLHNNSKESYRLYLHYAKYTRLIDDVLESERVRPWVEIASGLWVKDYVEFRAFWDKVTRQIKQKRQEEKTALQDQKAQLLKKQYDQFNKKYPLPNKEEQESVF